ncbi:LysR family transcriptional regulator [Ravibacter arvi]|uniref:LysR family transcriptional regulator n=1 Tax=Ravibacter arvi TaxID=2051041 RepID=A0ABP8LSA0_9BACT
MISIDFKIATFLAAARYLNFTKAGQSLNISQPAVSKNIHELELQAGRNLFERTGNRLALTEAGHILLTHAQQLSSVYEQLNEGLEILEGRLAGEIRLGASTTLSHYVVPQILVDFHATLPNIKIKTLHGNSRQIEEWLLDKTIDLGIVEGLTDNVSMKYESFLEDEIVLVARSGNPKAKEPSIRPESLRGFEFVLREQGSGTNEVIRKELVRIGIEWHELNVKVVLASTESIKSFLARTDCFSFLSIHAITRELLAGELQIIEIDNFEIIRDFYFVRPQGVIGRLPETFRRFAVRQFSKKESR